MSHYYYLRSYIVYCLVLIVVAIYIITRLEVLIHIQLESLPLVASWKQLIFS